MPSPSGVREMLIPIGMPRERLAAALRCLILLTVFAMARLQPDARGPALDLVIIVGAIYVLVSTFLPWSRYEARRATLIMLTVDVLLISALIYAQAGVRSEYYLLYYLPILYASARLGLRDAAGTCVLAVLCYLFVGVIERPDNIVTTTVISRVLTFSLSAGLLAGFFMLLARERRSYDDLTRHYEEAMQAKSDFLSRMSHEFRTPLTAIVGFSQLLHEHNAQLDPERQQEYLTIIREQSQALARMIEDVLDITRIDEGRLRLHSGAHHIAELVDSSLMLLDNPQDRMRVGVEFPPGALVWVDRGEIEQALSRFIAAALAAAGDGEQVSVVVTTPEAEVESLLVSISSSGLKLVEDDMSLVFGPSAALEKGRPTSAKALGLAVGKVLVEMHGGRVWVEEERGGGGAIKLTIPRYRRRDEMEPDIIPEPAAAKVPLLVLK